MKLEELEKKYAELGKEIEALKNKPEYDYDLAIELGCFFKFRDVDDEDYAIVDQLSDYDPVSKNPFVSKLNEGAWGEIEPVKERGYIQLHHGSAECPVPNEAKSVLLVDDEGDITPANITYLRDADWSNVAAYVWL